MAFVAVGPTEIVAAALCGPQQHDAHCRGWRYHFFIQDQAKLEARMRAELRAMVAYRRAPAGPPHNEHEWTRHYWLEGKALSRRAQAAE